MLNLYIIYENFINGYKDIFLDYTSMCATLSDIMGLISKNPIVSVLFLIELFLIGLFLSKSIYLIILGINFIKAIHALILICIGIIIKKIFGLLNLDVISILYGDIYLQDVLILTAYLLIMSIVSVIISAFLNGYFKSITMEFKSKLTFKIFLPKIYIIVLSLCCNFFFYFIGLDIEVLVSNIRIIVGYTCITLINLYIAGFTDFMIVNTPTVYTMNINDINTPSYDNTTFNTDGPPNINTIRYVNRFYNANIIPTFEDILKTEGTPSNFALRTAKIEELSLYTINGLSSEIDNATSIDRCRVLRIVRRAVLKDKEKKASLDPNYAISHRSENEQLDLHIQSKIRQLQYQAGTI